MTCRLGACFDNTNISDPVALPACEARLNILTLEVRSGSAKGRWVDTLKCIDIDYSVQVSVEFTGDEWYYAAARANMESRGLSSEAVL